MKDQRNYPSWRHLAHGVFVVFMAMVLLIMIGRVGIPAFADDVPPPPPPDSLNLSEDFRGKRVQELRVPNMTSSLNGLLDAWEQDPELAASFAATRGLELQAEFVKVMLIMVDEGSATSALEAIRINGCELIAHYKSWIDVWVPIDALESLAALPGVRQVREAIPVLPIEEMQDPEAKGIAVGSALTQGVAASNANAWHTAGITGSGVKVAVIDSFKDYASAQATGDLPPTIATYGTIGTSSRHGTAVAEIIYDMAPGVDFTFATPSSATQMATYIVDLAAAGNQIISSSIGYYNAEPGDGTGPVSDAISTAHDTYGTLYVQAAGDQANYHWDGIFNDLDGDGWHEFAAGLVEINLMGYLSSDVLINLYLRWNSWPVTDQDYDFCVKKWVESSSNWEIVAESEEWQTGNEPPTESIIYTTDAPAYYGIAIKNWSADGTQVLDLMGHNAPSFTENVSDRSLVDPATPSDSFSVVAVDVTSPYPLESYSSWGPTHGPGGALAGGLDKPRIAAFANVDTWSYGPGVFNGTSSATPHVSGAAALVLDAYPGYTPDQVINFLESRAVDQGDPGYDYKFGAGRLHLGDPPAAVISPGDFDGDGDTDITVYHWHATYGQQWYIKDQGTWSWGNETSIPVPADYDGDGDSDIAVYDNGTWYIKDIGAYGWGGPDSVPVPGDYDGDGDADIAVFDLHPTWGQLWYIKDQPTYGWGNADSLPVPADYNGDGTTDVAVYNDGIWYIKDIGVYGWGNAMSIPVPGDYDGDGDTDLAVYVVESGTGTWYVQGQPTTWWGGPDSIPVPGDYNGDGRTDIAVFNNGTWYVKDVLTDTWGGSGDYPIPAPDYNGDGDPYE